MKIKHIYLLLIPLILTYPYYSVILEFHKYSQKHKKELISYLDIPSTHISNVLNYRFQDKAKHYVNNVCYIDYFYISEDIDIVDKLQKALSQRHYSIPPETSTRDYKNYTSSYPIDCLRGLDLEDLTPVWKAPFFHHVDEKKILVRGSTEKIELAILPTEGKDIILLGTSRGEEPRKDSGYILALYKDINLIKVASHRWDDTW